MTTQAIFDPKYNIVGVDPNNNDFVQIPGQAFQAPTTPDTYVKFLLIPNFNTARSNHVGKFPPIPAGEYNLGFTIHQLSVPDPFQGDASYSFSPHNVHISNSYEPDANNYKSDNFYRQIVLPEYDKYIEHTGLTTYEYRDNRYTPDLNYGFIRVKWQEMKDDGLFFPSETPGSGFKSFLCFDLRVVINAPESIELGTDAKADKYELPAGPFSPPIVVPVRAYIPELWAKATKP